MKKSFKLLLSAILIAGIFASCKKNSEDLLPQPQPKNQNPVARLYRVSTEPAKADNTQVRCNAAPMTAAGLALYIREMLATGFTADGHGYYWFCSQAGIEPGAAMLTVTIHNGQRFELPSYFAAGIVYSTQNPEDLADFATNPNRPIVIPYNKEFTVAITGINKCGQRTTYSATFIMATTTRVGLIEETTFDASKVKGVYHADDNMHSEAGVVQKLQSMEK